MMTEQEKMTEEIFIGKLILRPDEIRITEGIEPSMINDPIVKDFYIGIRKEPNIASLRENLSGKYENIDKLIKYFTDIAVAEGYCLSVKNCCETIKRDHAKKVAESYAEPLSNITNADTYTTIEKLITDLTNLLPAGDAQVDKMSDLPSAFSSEYLSSEHCKRFMTGFDVIDRATAGIDDGDLVICAARPACGKTVFGLDIIRNNTNLKAGYFNLEMSARQIYERQIASIGKIPLGTLRRSVKRDPETLKDFQHSNEVLSTMKNCELITGTLSVADIERFVRIKHYDFIVIDYLGLIQPSGQYRGNKYAETSAISAGLKRIAMRYHIPVLALAQLNRESAKRDDKEPFLSELRDSGSIEQDASVVIMLWEHEDQTKRNIKIEKCRNGQRVRSTLIFDGEHMHFSEIGAADDNPFTKGGIKP